MSPQVDRIEDGSLRGDGDSGARRGPLVSVITIFLNEERFLREAVESVIGQTYRCWELLLCDDGSTDGSAAIARGYADAHPNRIRYLHHPDRQNRGMSATRNLGLSHARGEYVAFLDGDDVWLPEKLSRQVAVLEQCPETAMVLGPSLYWHSWTGRPEDAALDGASQLAAPWGRVTSGRALLTRIITDRSEAICTCSAVMRREAVSAVDGFENIFRGLFEDQVFFAKMLLATDVWVMEEYLDLYRQHPDSCCAVASRSPIELAEQRRAFLEWLRRYVTDVEAGPGLRIALMRELWWHRYPRVVEARRRLRETARRRYGRFRSVAYALGRRSLPAPVRSWLWARLGPEDAPGPTPAHQIDRLLAADRPGDSSAR